MTNPENTASTVSTSARSQAGNALIVQGYALSVQQQPTVDLGASKRLAPLQNGINQALTGAKDGAQDYLNVVLPKTIVTIADISAYFETQDALAQALGPDTDAQTAVSLLMAVQERATDFHGRAVAVTHDIQGLRERFSRSSAALSRSSTELAVAVDGDDGILKDLGGQLAGLDGKIEGAISGVVLSALTVAGGVIMVGVGALATAVTGGLATALVVGGLAVTAVGIGGEVTSSVLLAQLLDQKSRLITERSRLEAETTLAASLSSGLRTMSSSTASAAAATQNMANAWGLLGDDLDNLAKDLVKGRTDVDIVRRLFTTAAQGAVRTVQGDVAVIRGQLTGVRPVVDPRTAPGDLVRNQLAELQHS
ncbi:HBL/NHE enterotoxin family protein [Streptomyces sp. BE20]|uniref:HBL/NHE enterotoxin family protein n=1 Tax=Streptomyces sp. BE20 TaxID=3002525 RepID=UPI002E7A7E62|nr:HBL/NHE enterotoxin family protein [Streptomyces sp. BE20]MEE1821637.1 HBL/NHE enterotoxin family protein [Streptomyces sp. BE20]